MPSTTRSMKGSSASSSSSSSSSNVGTSGSGSGRGSGKRSLFAPSPPSKLQGRSSEAARQPAAGRDEEENKEAAQGDAAATASGLAKLPQQPRQATLYSLKLGAGGRMQRAEGKGAAAVAAAGGGGKRRKLDDSEEAHGGDAGPSASSTSGSKVKEEERGVDADDAIDEEDEAVPLRRSRSRSPTPRHPTDFLQVTSPTFLSTSYTPFPGCHYLSSFLPTTSPEPPSTTLSRWYTSLLSLPNWYNPTLRVYGRSIVQSRPIAAFSKVAGLPLRYSGQDARMDHPWPEVLREMEEVVRGVVGREVRFNHAFLNLYRDGSVNIGRHSDNLENRVIVTLSLGAPRKWIMTRRPPRGAQAAAKKSGQKLPPAERKAWTLKNGSLLVMQGDVQSEWYHEVPKEARVKEGRISVTFRQLVYD